MSLCFILLWSNFLPSLLSYIIMSLAHTICICLQLKVLSTSDILLKCLPESAPVENWRPKLWRSKLWSVENMAGFPKICRINPSLWDQRPHERLHERPHERPHIRNIWTVRALHIWKWLSLLTYSLSLVPHTFHGYIAMSGRILHDYVTMSGRRM